MGRAVVAILLSNPLPVAAAETRWQWAPLGLATANSDNVHGRCLATDSSGNVYVAGSFAGTSTFGKTNAPLTSFGGSDAFVASYDRHGVLRWVRKFGGPGFDTARALALDQAGNLYVAGGYGGPAVFDSITLTQPAAGFLAKFEAATAKLLWVREGALEWTGLALDAGGNCHLVGLPVNAHHHSAAESISLARYDSNGVSRWLTNSPLPDGLRTGRHYSITLDPAGNIHVFAHPGHPTDRRGSPTTGNPSLHADSREVRIASFDPGGFLKGVAGLATSRADGLRLERAILLGGDLVELRLAGASGQTVVTEASSNLPEWVPVFTNVPAGDAIRFRDPGVTGVSGRFYRLKLP
jgi:hypothetical protein